MRQLGVPPARALVFEDSIAGISAANAAGCRVLAVANRFTEPALRQQTIVPQVRPWAKGNGFLCVIDWTQPYNNSLARKRYYCSQQPCAHQQ